MKAIRQSTWRSDLTVGILSGILSSALVAAGGYLLLREHISVVVADGVQILDPSQALQSLDKVRSTVNDVSGKVARREEKDGLDLYIGDDLFGLRWNVDSLVRQVKTANAFQELDHIDPKRALMDIMARHYKPGSYAIDNLSSALGEILKEIDDVTPQLRKRNRLDARSIQLHLGAADALCAGAQVDLTNRHNTLLRALDRFGKQ